MMFDGMRTNTSGDCGERHTAVINKGEKLRTVGLIALALMAFYGSAFGEQSTSRICTAVVKDHTAQFAFPLPERQAWTWYMNATPNNDLEYVWEIILGDGIGTNKYNFGVYLYKYPGSQESTGSINQLLSIAQSSVWDNKSSRVREDLKVQSSIEGRKLIIRVSDKETSSELFSQRPTNFNCRVATPYEGANYQSGIPLVFSK
jgi:hypothetical protein